MGLYSFHWTAGGKCEYYDGTDALQHPVIKCTAECIIPLLSSSESRKSFGNFQHTCTFQSCAVTSMESEWPTKISFVWSNQQSTGCVVGEAGAVLRVSFEISHCFSVYTVVTFGSTFSSVTTSFIWSLGRSVSTAHTNSLWLPQESMLLWWRLSTMYVYHIWNLGIQIKTPKKVTFDAEQPSQASVSCKFVDRWTHNRGRMVKLHPEKLGIR